MPQKHLESLGEPIIKIGSLSVWIQGYEFPHATDGWDGNWLRVTARCAANGASVVVSGSLLDTVSFARWRRQVKALIEQPEGSATLKSHEPSLVVTLKAKGSGRQIDVETEITPDPLHQRHRFFDTVDQEYLKSIHAACDAVLRLFPVREAASRGDLNAD